MLLGLLRAIVPQSLAQDPGADALVAAYGFNEGSGTTAADASGNLLTATLSGATWSTAGRFGGAVSFNGISHFVTVNDSPLLDFTTAMTIQAWVYPMSLSGWRTVILKETSNGLAYALYAHDNAPRPASYINLGGTDLAAIGTAQLPLNTWTHLATTYDGSALKLYVNGVLVRNQAISGPIVTSANPLRFGGNSIWTEFFTGRIDEVRIHNRALTQPELQALMTAPVAQQQGFDINVYNNPVSVGLSQSGVYNLGIAPRGGFTAATIPSVTGLPAVTTAVFEPADGPPHPGPFALTVTTSASTPPGTYTLALTCTSGALSATTNLTLIVNGTPGFRISSEPNDLIISQGQTGVAAVQVQSENGFSQTVTLSASGLPAGVSATYTPSSLVPSGSSSVAFAVGASVTPGVYQVSLTATSGTLIRQSPFTLTVLQQGGGGSWRQLSAGDSGAMFYGVIVGDVGGTGTQRVFASAGDGIMFEYLYNGTAWTFSRMPVGVFADGEMHNMAVGPGRRDGVNRLYIAAAGSGRVYEMSWVNGAWQTATVVTLNGSTDIIIGDGRNDGMIRMYITWMAGLTEFTWNGTGWTPVTISSNEANDNGWVHGNDMGAGRNDGIQRIYTANQGNGEVYEYTWNGATWIKLLMGDIGDARNIEVGVGRNDGVSRVYVASGGGNVYEFTWSGTAWQMISMGNAGISDVKVQSIPVKARADNLVRIYVAAGSGVYEYNWTGSAWQSVRLGNATAYMYGLAAGDGLNNGRAQVYGSSYDGNVFVFDWVPSEPPPSTVTVPNVVGQTQQAANTAITNAGLVVGTTTNASSATVPSGSVISQSPVGGTQAQSGSAVNLVISTGPTASSLAVDKVVFSDGNGARTTPAFSTVAADEILIAFASSDGPGSGGQRLTVSGAGLTWQLVRRANGQLGSAEIWWARAPNQLSNVTVRCTQRFGNYHQSLTVVTYRGASGIGASAAAGARSGAPTISLTTTKAGSFVYGVGNDWSNAIARTLGSGQQMIHQWVDTSAGNTFWVQARNAPVSSPSVVQINATAPTNDRWNLAAVEIVSK